MDPEQYRGYMTLQGLSDGTIRTYSSFYTRWWGHPRAPSRSMWTAQDVRAWSRTLPQTRASLEQARSAVAMACRAQGITDDLAAAIIIPRQAAKTPSRALDPDESHQLHATAEATGLKGLAVLVGLYTAARRSEIAQLAWSGVDWARREITLARPKNRDRHTVPMHPTLARHLSLWQLDGDMWVFPGRHGGHVSPATIWEWVREVADAAGVAGVTVHRLRHTCLTEIVDATGDLRAAQEIAGHASPVVTSRYTRASQERKVAAIRALDGYCAA